MYRVSLKANYFNPKPKSLGYERSPARPSCPPEFNAQVFYG